MILREYNINVINFNNLINNVNLNTANFIYNYNLSLNEKSRDLKSIIQHYIITEILNNLNNEYKNVIIYSQNFEIEHLNLNKESVKIIITDILSKSSKIFKFCLFQVEDNLLLDDKNFVIKLKHLSECKKKIDYSKITKFCENSKLNDIRKKMEDNKIKLKLIK